MFIFNKSIAKIFTQVNWLYFYMVLEKEWHDFS
jgi:hypothetical protein